MGGERREWQETKGEQRGGENRRGGWRVMYVEQRRSGGDERSEDGSFCSFTSALIPGEHRDCWGTIKMHFFPQRSHSPIWLCVRTFLRLCTVLCVCVIMAYCIAHFHTNVSLRILARCVCAGTHNIPWNRREPLFESWAAEVIAYV